jgi:hypothetical protein
MYGSRCCILISSAVISTATGNPPLLCHAETYTPKNQKTERVRPNPITGHELQPRQSRLSLNEAKSFIASGFSAN